jgi:hypothetical protein
MNVKSCPPGIVHAVVTCGGPNMTHLLVPAAFLGACLQGSPKETRTTRDLGHKTTTNTRAITHTPTAYIKVPRAVQDFSILKLLLYRERLSSQLFLLRFPSPLQQQGCATPLPRCIPPQAPSPRSRTCDTHAPRTTPILQSLSITPS